MVYNKVKVPCRRVYLLSKISMTLNLFFWGGKVVTRIEATTL